jgi:hypothetical protein
MVGECFSLRSPLDLANSSLYAKADSLSSSLKQFVNHRRLSYSLIRIETLERLTCFKNGHSLWPSSQLTRWSSEAAVEAAVLQPPRISIE